MRGRVTHSVSREKEHARRDIDRAKPTTTRSLLPSYTRRQDVMSSLSALPQDTVSSLVVPHLALAGYLVCFAGAGALANAAVVAALFRRERNVFHSIIMQLAISDMLLLCGAAGFETWAHNEGNWRFGCTLCTFYLGCEVFASTASIYFVVTLVLHAISTANLEESNARLRRPKTREEDSDAEMRSSRHSLVANSDSSTPPRTMNIDYRIANSSVPVVVPLVFVWILAASLSVPEFTLATTVTLENELTLCTFADPSHRINIHSLLVAFDLFIPAFILTSSGAFALGKLRTRRRKSLEERAEAASALKLSICMVVVYLVMCAPRSILGAYHAYEFVSPQEDYTGSSRFRNPLLSDIAAPHSVGLTLSCVSYAAALVRPVLCVIIFPDLRRSFSFANRAGIV